jgi:hypothetical protein
MKTKICKWSMLVVAVFILAMAQQTLWPDEELPAYLKDRGKGMTMSLNGVYIEKGEFLVYPFYEYTTVPKEEYNGSELGYSGEANYVGKSRERETLLFLGYGITSNLAVEIEGALSLEKTLYKATNDKTSGIPDIIKEKGHDLEMQLRWRFLEETERRPELFFNFEIDFPMDRNKYLVGATDWELGAGINLVKGFSWGTVTPRIALGYNCADKQLTVAEYAVEYLKKLSDSWRWVTMIESEDKSMTIFFEAQWFVRKNMYFKFNSGFGLTESAPSFAPEIGLAMVF